MFFVDALPPPSSNLALTYYHRKCTKSKQKSYNDLFEFHTWILENVQVVKHMWSNDLLIQNTCPTPRPPPINGNPSLRIREKHDDSDFRHLLYGLQVLSSFLVFWKSKAPVVTRSYLVARRNGQDGHLSVLAHLLRLGARIPHLPIYSWLSFFSKPRISGCDKE